MTLATSRLDEIRDLLAALVARRDTPITDADSDLLGHCRSALTDVLNDRDSLAASHAELAEELALWNGAL